MKVLIAEKPSVAQSIAAIVGANSRKDGYLEGNGYAVTWAFGHLVGLAMPQDYGITGFQAENLPILPSEFKLLPRQVKDGKEYKPDAGALKQLKVIKELFGKSDLIINCCDAGREGEAIFRYIYNYLECRKPFDRLWISSLTDTAIRNGLENLRSGKEYDNLYASAKARSQVGCRDKRFTSSFHIGRLRSMVVRSCSNAHTRHDLQPLPRKQRVQAANLFSGKVAYGKRCYPIRR